MKINSESSSVFDPTQAPWAWSIPHWPSQSQALILVHACTHPLHDSNSIYENLNAWTITLSPDWFRLCGSALGAEIRLLVSCCALICGPLLVSRSDMYLCFFFLLGGVQIWFKEEDVINGGSDRAAPTALWGQLAACLGVCSLVPTATELNVHGLIKSLFDAYFQWRWKDREIRIRFFLC